MFPKAEENETYIYNECNHLAEKGKVRNFIKNIVKKLNEYMSFAHERRKISLLFPNVFMLQRTDFEKIIFFE